MPSYPFIHVLEFYCHAICYEHHGLQIIDDPGTCLELETRECESVYKNSSYTFRYALIGLQQDRDRIMLGDAISSLRLNCICSKSRFSLPVLTETDYNVFIFPMADAEFVWRDSVD